QKTLIGGTDALGLPLGVHPVVSVIDANGNDVPGLQNNQLNPVSQSDLRIDNESVQPPLTFQIPQSQGEWVNGTYVFSSSSTGTAPAVTSVKYQSCGDAPPSPTAQPAQVAQPAAQSPCLPQSGVSAAAVTNGGASPATTLKFFAFDVTTPGVTVPAALTGGTSTSTTTCVTNLTTANGWIAVTTNAGALTEGPTNTRYIVRAVETDRLGNVRCTDLA